MLATLLLALLPWQEPESTPPQKPAVSPPPAAAPKVVEAWDDRRAKAAARALQKTFKSKSASMRDRSKALEVVALGANKALVKPLCAIIEKDKSIVIRKRAATLLANQPTKDASLSILKLLKSAQVASQNNVMAELVRSLSRAGYESKHWDELDGIFESEYDLDRVVLQEALLVLVTEHKEKKAIPVLLRNIDEPIPVDVEGQQNPPAAYWEARWKSWQRWRGNVKEALFAVTGQRFSTSAEAKTWLAKNPLK